MIELTTYRPAISTCQAHVPPMAIPKSPVDVENTLLSLFLLTTNKMSWSYQIRSLSIGID